MRIKLIGSFLIASISFIANASESYLGGNQMQLTSTSFAAPVVYDKTDLTDATIGAIVYEAGSGFFGLTNSGAPSSSSSWVALGGPSGTASVVSGGTERIERAYITNNGSCSIGSQSGSWVSSVSRPLIGDCTLTLASGVFSANPTCTCAGELNPGTEKYQCSLQVSSATSVRVHTAIGSGSDADRNFYIICMGPQ